MTKKPEHTETPWHHHDMETATLCGPDHGAIADFGARGRSVEENRANANLALESINRAPEMQAEIDRLEAELEDADKTYNKATQALLAESSAAKARIDELESDRDVWKVTAQANAREIGRLKAELLKEELGNDKLQEAYSDIDTLRTQVEQLRGALSSIFMDIGTMMKRNEEPQVIRMTGELAQDTIHAVLAETEKG